MATQVSPNAAYVNATKVSNKYNPFDPKPNQLKLAKSDKALYSKMLTFRCALLKKLNVLPQVLRLMTSDWPAVEGSEVGKKPPLVVVSSNRAGWIKSGIAAADAELNKLGIGNFNNVNDFRALKGTAGRTVSPPIYCPKRLGAAPLSRNVYIVVHSSEYDKYKTDLAASGITVIGWEFVKPKDAVSFVGFGASRFAAIEFCKVLRARVAKLGNVWDYAWLLDDNVVALEYFAGLEKVEDALQIDKVCSGFHGADRTYPNSEMKTYQWTASPYLPASKEEGILQQVGLWNIKYLTDNFLNFPPIYVTSAEDISLNRYFNLKNVPYNYYDTIIINKELVPTVQHDGAGEVKKSRQHYANLFARRESGIPVIRPVPAPPPPFNVTYAQQETSVVQFVTTRLLVNEPEDDRYTAACQAVEQITKTAIRVGASYIEDAALTATFQTNGQTTQIVELVKS